MVKWVSSCFQIHAPGKSASMVRAQLEPWTVFVFLTMRYCGPHTILTSAVYKPLILNIIISITFWKYLILENHFKEIEAQSVEIGHSYRAGLNTYCMCYWAILEHCDSPLEVTSTFCLTIWNFQALFYLKFWKFNNLTQFVIRPTEWCQAVWICKAPVPLKERKKKKKILIEKLITLKIREKYLRCPCLFRGCKYFFWNSPLHLWLNATV